MFSVDQKRAIAQGVQTILRDTRHPELPSGEIQFHLHVKGAESWSWADIKNNGAVAEPGVNPWNEAQAAQPMQTMLSLSLDVAAGASLFDLLTEAKQIAEWTRRRVDFKFNGYGICVYHDTNIQGELEGYNRHCRSQQDQCFAYRGVTGRVNVGTGEPGAGIMPMAYGPRWSMEAFAETENKK